MGSSSKPTVEAITFDHPVNVEVSEAPFVFLDTIKYLDVDRLREAEAARIPLGIVDTDCCRQIVYGLTEKGMLTSIEFHQDHEETRTEVDDATLELVKAASAALGKKAPTRKLPIPLSEVVENPQALIETWTCTRICVVWMCITCCSGEGPGKPWTVCSSSVRATSVSRPSG